MAQCAKYHKPLIFEQIDMIRYVQDYLEFKGQGCLYKIYLLLYDRKGWREYIENSKGLDRRQALRENELKFYKFRKGEKKKWQEQVKRK